MKNLKNLKLGFKVLAGLLVVALAFSIIMPITGRADYEDENYEYYLQDINQLLTNEQTDALEKNLQDAANAAKCNVDIYIINSLDGYLDVSRYAQEVVNPLLSESIGEIALVYYVETLENGNVKRDSVILCNDKVPEPYSEIKSEITSGDIYVSAQLDGDSAALNKFCQTIIAHNPPVNMEYKNSDDNLLIRGNEWKAALADYDDCLTDSEEQSVLNKMETTAETVKCNIGIVITRDLGNYDDVGYVRAFAEDCFGYGSDSITLMLLNTHKNPAYTYYQDQIDRMGAAQNKFDKYVNKIYDKLYYALDKNGASSTSDFKAACIAFCDALQQYESTDFNGNAGFMRDWRLSDHVPQIFFALIVGIVIALIITSIVAKKYKKKAPISATQYIDRRTVHVTWTRDDFIREYTTSVRVESNRSGHHGGGGGHSGGGGHHTSGGRHR